MTGIDATGNKFNFPDKQIESSERHDLHIPIRGYGSLVVVLRGGKYIGWISTTNLPGGPYKNVMEWIDKVNPEWRHNHAI